MKVFPRAMLAAAISVAVASILIYSAPVRATLWHPGDEITYTQTFWSDDPTASSILSSDYNTVYAATLGVVEVGIPGASGFSMRFSDPSFVLAYLPASGTPAALDADVLNPATTSSGIFGGDVLALQFNVDFSDAGFLAGASGIPFGDLVLENFSTLPNLNGLTVGQFLSDVNVLLGGGTSIYDIATLDPITFDLSAAFFAGDPFGGPGEVSQFAQDHLVAPGTTAAPEPSSLVLIGIGLAGLGFSRRRKH